MQIKLNYIPLKNDLIETIATIRSAYKVRRHSIFGYMCFMFVDIFPRITKKSIEKEVSILKANIEKNEKGIE